MCVCVCVCVRERERERERAVAAGGPPRKPRHGLRRRAGRREEEGDEIGERKREIERRERGCNADKWAPLPRGVHVSETGHQNSQMAKCERF